MALYLPLPVGMMVVVVEMGRFAIAMMARPRAPLVVELTIRTNLLVNALVALVLNLLVLSALLVLILLLVNSIGN